MSATNNIVSVSKAEIEKLRDLKKITEFIGVSKSAHLFYKAKDAQAEAQQAKEIYFRLARQAGFVLLPENTPREQGGAGRFGSFDVQRTTPYQEALESTGITPFVANTWQKLAMIEEREFEAYLANPKFEHTEYTITGLLKYAAMVHVSDDSYEWYTPKEYIQSARVVMGGIDTDPATSETAQKLIKAKSYYTKQDDGLSKEWRGNVWLNPPFCMPDVERFIKRVKKDYESGAISQACVVTNNATDTRWFHLLANEYPFCLTNGRIPFWNELGNTQGGRQGQVIFYLGKHENLFKQEFSKYGIVVKKL